MPSHLFRRNAVYCTRLIVPPRLRPIIGKSDLGQSLRTKDLAEAKRLLPYWLAEARATLAAAEAELRETSAVAAPAPRGSPRADPFAGMTQEQFEAWERHQAEELQQASAEDDLEERLALPESRLSPEEVAAARLVKQARQDRDRYRDRYYARRDRDTATPAVNDNGASVSGITLDAVIELWAAERRIQAKGVATHKAVARWFYERMGRKPVGTITRQDVLGFKAKLVAEGQSPANIKMKLSRLRTLLQYAADNGQAAANAAAGVSIKDPEAAKNKRKPFDLASLNAIFGSPVYANGDRPTQGRGEAAYWLPLLALFTGARLEELGQLRPHDVERLIYPDADGKEQAAWFIRITEDEADGLKLKNAASDRLVPVHPELERLGFVRHALAMKAEKRARIFHELRPGAFGRLTAKWGEWFSRYRRDVCGVVDRRMVFHSFRHTFKDYARHVGMAEGVQRQIMGHSGDDVADDYGSGHSLHQLVEGMKLYRVPGLSIRTLE